jgi:protease PrsW
MRDPWSQARLSPKRVPAEGSAVYSLPMYTALLLLVSAGPGVLFLVLIMRMDRREPEPLSLVLRVIALGAASAIVASLVEIALDLVPLFGQTDLRGTVASSFIQVAPVEELCKLGVVLLFVWRNPNFNEENDGIVYVGASAIGFAVLENFIYVFENGIDTGILRAFTAIPLHVFAAVVMGLFVGRARFEARIGRRALLVIIGFAIAWFIHGLYDSLALAQSGLPLLILPVVAATAAFGIMALRRGRRLSAERWGDTSGSVPTVAKRSAPRRAAPRWIAVVSRVLMIGCAVFWVFMIIGFFATSTKDGLGLAALGGLMLTFFPLCIGLILEIVYRRWRKRSRRAADTQVAE